jgi:hypothetical protein
LRVMSTISGIIMAIRFQEFVSWRNVFWWRIHRHSEPGTVRAAAGNCWWNYAIPSAEVCSWRAQMTSVIVK